MEISVVSWNVNSINARLERAKNYLARAKPDVLCLQELKCETAKVPVQVFSEFGYEVIAHGQPTYNGVAILAKEPIELINTGFSVSDLDVQARLIHGRVHGLDVICVYVPNGKEVASDKFQFKLQWLHQLGSYLDQNFDEGDQYVVCGDFNIATDERDVFDSDLMKGQLHFSTPERDALRNLMEDRLVDTFRQFESKGNHYSWWDYRGLGFPLDKGLRIDYVFASPALSEFTTSAWIDRDERKGERPSDHAPVGATFELV